MKKLILAFFAAIILFPTEALAWGQEGHRIVAEIAYRNVKPSTRRHIDKVAGKHGIVYWANWPDELRSDTIYPDSFNWHFQDMDGGMTDAEVIATLTNYPDPSTGRLWAISDSLTNVLRHNPADLDALRFMVHFMGDRFCPMHTAHIDDKGGNGVKMKFFGRNTNLHSVWDSGIIESRGFTYTEYVEYLLNRFNKADKKAILAMSVEEITIRNYHTCCAIYDYQDKWMNDPKKSRRENPYVYVYDWKDTLEWNLYAAGIRLAQLLDSLY